MFLLNINWYIIKPVELLIHGIAGTLKLFAYSIQVKMIYKEKLKYLFFIILFLFNFDLFAANPKFDLRLTNRNYISSNEGYFDIVIKHTNPGQSDFLYAGAEYVIILNTDFQTEHLNYIYAIDTATYGTERIPLNYIGGLSKNSDTLKLIQGDSILTGNEPVISSTSGTLVARIRFYNPDLYSNSCLLEEQFSWKTVPPGVFTKVYFRNNGETNLINNSFSTFSTYDLCVGSFCCLEAPLHPPVRISPENNSTHSAPVTLQWQKGFPVNYSAHLQIAEDSAFSNILFDSSFTLPDGNENVSVTLALLITPGDYYWRVKQGGIPPQGAYNEPWKFSIMPGSITLNLTVIPEGLYRFNQFDFEYKAYLRNADAPFELVDSFNVSSSDSLFENTLIFRNALPGRYYIVVSTPGCVETWSKEGGEYIEGGGVLNEYDFTLDDSQAFYENLILVRNKYCIYSGDVNQDQNIDLFDVLSVYYNSNNFKTTDSHTDLTGDNITDLSDILIAENNSKKFVISRSPVPTNQNLVSSGHQLLKSP